MSLGDNIQNAAKWTLLIWIAMSFGLAYLIYWMYLGFTGQR